MPTVQASITMDSKKLLTDIKAHQATNNKAIKHLDDTDPRWTQLTDGLVRHDGRIYVLETGNLQLRVLQYKHDNILLGHFGQNKTLASVQCKHTWPGLQNFIIEFCKSFTTCMCSKSQRHHGLLKQLPILEQPWNSISMDFIEQLPKSSGVRFAYGISPKACAQRSLCRRYIAQSFEANSDWVCDKG